MIDRLDVTDEYLVKCDFILNTIIFIDAALNISLRKFETLMFLFYFIYLANGFRMRPKVRSSLNSRLRLENVYTYGQGEVCPEK